MKRPVVLQGLVLNDFSRMAGLRLSGTQKLYCCFFRPWEHMTIDIFGKFKPNALVSFFSHWLHLVLPWQAKNYARKP